MSVPATSGRVWLDYRVRQHWTPIVASNDTYGAIAYQFILGGAVPIPSVRGLAMTIEYRFFGMGSRGTSSEQAAFDAPVTFGTAKLGNDFNHSVMIGALQFWPAATTPARSTCARSGSGTIAVILGPRLG